MSTIRNAVFDDASDSENDPDFVPDNLSDSDRKSEGRGSNNAASNEQDEVKKKREAEEKEARDALWASFQSAASAPPMLIADNTTRRKLVKVEKRYRFAGEDIVEVIEVPEGSEDAKKWPPWNSLTENGAVAEGEGCSPAGPSEKTESPHPLLMTSSGTGTSSTPKPESQNAGPSKRLGPRKPKTSLTLHSQKPKKLTTLEKSALDWKAHISTEGQSGTGVKDELEANRRGGGYLDRVDFLERVGERREEIFDKERAAKRRRG